MIDIAPTTKPKGFRKSADRTDIPCTHKATNQTRIVSPINEEI
jgi:hypothetical protein